MADLQKLWVEKYRPNRVEEYIWQDNSQKKSILRMIGEGSIPHLLLAGVQGSGKTTLSKMLITALNLDPTDVLLINASDENSVDVMRDKIKGFVSSWAIGDFKVVQLEEADYLSPNAQAILRQLMEQYADVARFILTCNYDHKIIPALKSRVQEFRFHAFDKDDIAERIAEILISEHVKFNVELLDKYVASGYPDIRKIINMVQQGSIDGVLQSPTEQESGDYKFQMLNLLASDSWLDIRKLLCANVPAEEWEAVYRFMYENLNKSGKFANNSKWEEGIVVIADHLYKHGICADPEINAAAMFIRLSAL
jgi:DNA polymerase III delta prime subunit